MRLLTRLIVTVRVCCDLMRITSVEQCSVKAHMATIRKSWRPQTHAQTDRNYQHYVSAEISSRFQDERGGGGAYCKSCVLPPFWCFGPSNCIFWRLVLPVSSLGVFMCSVRSHVRLNPPLPLLLLLLGPAFIPLLLLPPVLLFRTKKTFL